MSPGVAFSVAACARPALVCNFPSPALRSPGFCIGVTVSASHKGLEVALLRQHPGITYGAPEVLGFGNVAGSPAKASGPGVLWGGFYENFLFLLSRFVS